MLSVRSDCGVLLEACALPPSSLEGPVSREGLAIKKLAVLAVLGGNRHCRITIKEQKHEVLPLACSYLDAFPLDPASPITTQLQVTTKILQTLGRGGCRIPATCTCTAKAKMAS